jgi:hypothetical protein
VIRPRAFRDLISDPVGPKPHPFSELPLRDLMPLLSPPELAFFSTLDAELDKIETFYLARENEMKIRTELLGQQLNELAEHRKLFNVTFAVIFFYLPV